MPSTVTIKNALPCKTTIKTKVSKGKGDPDWCSDGWFDRPYDTVGDYRRDKDDKTIYISMFGEEIQVQKVKCTDDFLVDGYGIKKIGRGEHIYVKDSDHDPQLNKIYGAKLTGEGQAMLKDLRDLGVQEIFKAHYSLSLLGYRTLDRLKDCSERSYGSLMQIWGRGELDMRIGDQELLENYRKAPAGSSAGATGPHGGETAISYGVDVRSMRWYSRYRHTVFGMIGSCIEKNAERVSLVGVSGDADKNTMTTAEFPALQEDLAAAMKERKAPFNDGRFTFDMISIQRDSIGRLARLLEHASSNEDYAIVCSCPDPHFDKAQEIVRAHNRASREKGLNKVEIGWATAKDVY